MSLDQPTHVADGWRYFEPDDVCDVDVAADVSDEDVAGVLVLWPDATSSAKIKTPEVIGSIFANGKLRLCDILLDVFVYSNRAINLGSGPLYTHANARRSIMTSALLPV